MDDAALMGVLHRIADVGHQLDAFPNRQPARVGKFSERRAVHQLHRNERRRRLVARVGGVDMGDTRMLQMREDLGFDLEAALNCAGHELAAKHLERNHTRRMLLVGEIHDARRACSDLTDDDVVADDGTGRQGYSVALFRGRLVDRADLRLRFADGTQQTLDFLSELGVALTLLVEPLRALISRHSRQREEDRGRAIACGRLHGASLSSASSPLARASCSQARAKAHSFLTVAGEISIAAAVSSMVRPAK